MQCSIGSRIKSNHLNIQKVENLIPTLVLIDILWYHNSKFIKSNGDIKIDINFERCKTTCVIMNASEEHVGFYQCKAINDVSEEVTRAKFELASASNIAQVPVEIIEEIIVQPENIIDVIKSESSECDQTRKIRKQSKKSVHKSQVTQGTPQPQSHVKEGQIEFMKESKTSVVTNIEVNSTTYANKELDVEFREETEEVHIKVYEEILSELDIHTFKLSDEVNQILISIGLSKFGVCETALRELATIGCLLQKGTTVYDVMRMYDADIFPYLKIPESQAAMVQLVERHGYGSIITDIFGEETEDEHLLASTVGFRAFMRLIETHDESFETIISKFQREDFVSHEWKQDDCKEEIIEAEEGILVTTEQRITSGNCCCTST